MGRWRGAALAAGSVALAGLPASSDAVAAEGSRAPTEPAGVSHCAVWAPTGAEACFATFAETLRWIGFADVADAVSLESFFASSSPTAPSSVRAGSTVGRGALDVPPGYAYGALKDGAASRVYWGPSPSCPATWDSLVFDSGWNNRATAVMNGVCGSIKVFDAWSGSDPFACDTSTWMATATGGWGSTTFLPSAASRRTSCVGYVV